MISIVIRISKIKYRIVTAKTAETAKKEIVKSFAPFAVFAVHPAYLIFDIVVPWI